MFKKMILAAGLLCCSLPLLAGAGRAEHATGRGVNFVEGGH